MHRLTAVRRLALTGAIVIAMIAAGTTLASAQSLGELNRKIDALEPQVAQGVSNPAVASEAITQLDAAEAAFSRVAEGARINSTLMSTYDRLESMLNRMYTTYTKKKDACIVTVDAGGTCDYTQPEQLALRALYPLSWLRFEGASLYANEPATARRLLNQAIDGFTDSSLLILSPELIRENQIGRAYAERELGKYDHAEYAHAVADFKRIIEAGPGTRQYRPAQQGLAMTYAAMGKTAQAQGMTSKLAENASGAQKEGLEMLRLREMFGQEAAASDPAKRANLHHDIIEFARSREDDKNGWAIVVATAGDNVHDPVAEFGGTTDGFENWLGANVAYYKHQMLPAANLYWAAAHSGKYPKAYKYAADLFYTGGRIDMVEKVAQDIASQPSNPDAQWADYILFKIPRLQWERTGRQRTDLRDKWIGAAQTYLKNFPQGHYAYEPRFRMGEMYQHEGKYVEAAKEYEQVHGNSDYDFTARFNAAECYYRALAAAGGVKIDNAGSLTPAADPVTAPATQFNAADLEAMRQKTIAALIAAINLEPNAERAAPAAQHKALHDSRGRAIFMLATLLEHQPKVDYREVASILDGYESQYPAMKAKFNQTYEWRVQALAQTGQYPQLQREARALVAHDAVNPAQNDFVKEIGLDFWQNAQARQATGDHRGYVENARLTAIIYEYFARMVSEGKIPAKNLTGTLSILGQAYLAMDEVDKAQGTFRQVATADAASPDANAGLARIAQSKKDYKDAIDLWSRVESVAAESDPLFYEAKYSMAEILAGQGNLASACNKLTVTRSEHPNLGSPGMKAQWGELQHKLCENHSEG
jgi:tetratricopeptide (TPR) repeat protein